MDQQSDKKKKKNKVTVNIYGSNYTMRTAYSEEQVEKIVAYLNEKMQEVGLNQSRLNYRDVAVLAALNIVDELLNVKEDYQQLLKNLSM